MIIFKDHAYSPSFSTASVIHVQTQLGIFAIAYELSSFQIMLYNAISDKVETCYIFWFLNYMADL